MLVEEEENQTDNYLMLMRVYRNLRSSIENHYYKYDSNAQNSFLSNESKQAEREREQYNPSFLFFLSLPRISKEQMKKTRLFIYVCI